MAHAVNFLLAALEEELRKRLMPRRLWPPKFPDWFYAVIVCGDAER
jgi:hypothetical protein